MELLALGAAGALLIAAFIDVFFVTGIFFSGLFLLAMVGTLYTTGEIGLWETIPFLWVGSWLGNLSNFFAGKQLTHLSVVRRTLANPRVAKLQERASGIHFVSFVGLVLISRALGMVRPFYGLAFGAADIKTIRFVTAETIAVSIWVFSWITLAHYSIGSVAHLFQS